MTTTNRSKKHNSEARASEEVASLVLNTEPVQQLYREIEGYPITLFKKIGALADQRNNEVPDYLLGLVPYLGEMSMRALSEAGLIKAVDRGVHLLHAYQVTDKGKELWTRLQAETEKEADEKK